MLRGGRSKKSWSEEERHALGTVVTVEDYWSLTAQLEPPSALPVGCALLVFRAAEASEASWEAFPGGGAWELRLGAEGPPASVHEAWQATLVAALGEQLVAPGTDAGEVCGARLTRRRAGWKLAVWTRTAADSEAQLAVGHALRALLRPTLPAEALDGLAYVAHAAARRRASAGRSLDGAEEAPPLYTCAAPKSECESPLKG